MFYDVTNGATICVRADGGTKSGIGHVMRCLALAQGWMDSGGKVVFVIRTDVEPLCRRLEADGIEVIRMSAENECVDDVVRSRECEWLVVDGYEFDAEYLAARRRASGVQLLVVDDLADRDLSAADVILNPNAFATALMYGPQAKDGRLLLGCEYALLRREFREGSIPLRDFPAIARKVLVVVGGGDTDNITQVVLERLIIVPDRLQITVVIGTANPHMGKLQAALPQLRETHDVELLLDPPNLRELMESADLAISAAGSTVWELANRGVPMLLVVIADNQRLTAAYLKAAGLCRTLGLHSSTPNLDIATISALIHGRLERRQVSAQLQKLVDARGSLRVAAALLAHPMRLRHASHGDAELLWRWANAPEVRQAGFSSAQIPWSEHLQWLERKLTGADSVIWIAIDSEGTPVGQIRFDNRNSGEAVVSVSIASDYRGAGLATKVIRLGVFKIFEDLRCQKVVALIKPHNQPSQRAFARAGFKNNGSILYHGHPAQIWQFSR